MKPTDIKSKLTVERVRWLFRYDPVAGKFFWRNKPHPCAIAVVGKEVGRVDTSGYMRVTFDRRTWLVHRLIWLYAYGQWPRDRVDHINLDILDNRIGNLREATQAQNCANRNIHTNAKSGRKGVGWHKRRGKWTAQIKVGQRLKYLGLFETIEEAAAAYDAAARAEFGEFARTR